MIKVEFIDKYASKYRHSKKYPIGIPSGENLYRKFKSSEAWALDSEEKRIIENNDNRLDNFLGKSFIFKNVTTGDSVFIKSSYSNSGKTVIWSFESECEEFLF
jgi:hypothetical protein